MAVKEKVCRNCKRFVTGSVCPVCNESNFSRSWKGVVVINDPKDSEIAKIMGITVPGKYCIWVK
ncbi:MAG: DNA-directed RNA polymerase subunit E'' [Candidatus Aenigmatarchaeota archaeon]|nr:MAG: DNA-directed RNA polymerase subunit E'' [Candidatus Aenigmarchaeota archaeon]RLJ08276.1 MAG: DNA-directed RNA polymerase subunit E'' [Candidatus Aenigmarchaeota archaeon]